VTSLTTKATPGYGWEHQPVVIGPRRYTRFKKIGKRWLIFCLLDDKQKHFKPTTKHEEYLPFKKFNIFRLSSLERSPA